MENETPLEAHERRDAAWYADVEKRISGLEDKTMDGINSDKVSINVGGEGGGGGGAGLAAVIAALGNRNQGNDNAALIAALGNRNDHSRDDGFSGGGMLGIVALLALLNRGRGGFGGDDGCAPGGIGAGHAALLQTLLEGQSNLRAEVPTTALETQNAIQSAVGALALGTQQGFANVKDSVQASLLANLTATSAVKDTVQTAFTVLNQNVSEQGCKTRETVQATSTAILQKLDQNEIDRLRHERDSALRTVDVNALRSQVEVNQTVTSTASAAQSQFQVQSQVNELAGLVRNLASIVAIGNQTMLARQAQDIVNLGTMTASGTQASANTQVR